MTAIFSEMSRYTVRSGFGGHVRCPERIWVLTAPSIADSCDVINVHTEAEEIRKFVVVIHH
jgi:hypothetical protein